MKKLMFPLLLTISINCFGQEKKDTIQCYHVFVDIKTNHVRGYMGYLERTFDGFIYEGGSAGGYVVKDIVISLKPLDQRKKPFPKTFLLIKSQDFEQEPVIW